MAATSDTVWLLATPLGILVSLICYLVLLGVYRIFLHPLANVPGPKIAALTAWYELYWDCPRKGRFFTKIKKMHIDYGPVVRINPWEVHIDDPDFFNVFYLNPKLDKHLWFYRLFGDNMAAVGTVNWERHKARRGAMAKFFSSANISKLEPKIQARVQKLLDRFEEHRAAGKVVDVSNAYRCYATDVVSEYAAPHTRDFLSTPDFSAAFTKAVRKFSGLMLWHRHLPIIFPIMNAIPKFVIASMDPDGANIAVLENREDLVRQARTVIKTKGVPGEKQAPTILDAVYTSPLLGPEDKTEARLISEAQAVLGAGTETTGNTLAVFTYHVLSQPAVLKRLKIELQDAARISSPSGLMNYKILERLPYLQASIKESLRVATGVVSRLPRVHRTESTTYITPSGKQYIFPPNQVISMSILDLHYNKDIFDQGESFVPERWLDSDTEKLKQRERAFAPFGRGARQCIGLELAKREITLLIGNLFHRFDLQLFETTSRDVSIEHDYFAPWAYEDSGGVQVRLM